MTFKSSRKEKLNILIFMKLQKKYIEEEEEMPLLRLLVLAC